MNKYFSCIYAQGPNGEFGLRTGVKKIKERESGEFDKDKDKDKHKHKDKNGDIEYRLPWPKLSSDMKHFKNVTSGGIVIYGSATFSSLGKRPLENRINIVVSSSLYDIYGEGGKGSFESNTEGFIDENLFFSPSLDKALELCALIRSREGEKEAYVIGGSNLLLEAMKNPYCEYIYLTCISGLYNNEGIVANIYIDSIPEDYVYLGKEENGNGNGNGDEKEKDERKYEESKSVNIIVERDYVLQFKKFMRIRNSQENQYLNLCKKLLLEGEKTLDRTGTGTLSLWGETMKFNLEEEFPIYTTKKISFKNVVKELLFFISGKTDTKILENEGVNIWKGNTSRDYLDKRGFHSYNEGEAGPIYGFQWRHYGAEYTPNVQYSPGDGNGKDQLAGIIDNIKNLTRGESIEHGRRLVINSWNPLDIDKMCLPPCHYSMIFSVSGSMTTSETEVDTESKIETETETEIETKTESDSNPIDKSLKLNCMVIMRSNDVFLGNPYNVTSYALLTCMIAKLANIKPGKLVLSVANFHLYNNHIEQIKLQIQRPPRKWPSLVIRGEQETIDDFCYDDFYLIGYEPHKFIRGEMSA